MAKHLHSIMAMLAFVGSVSFANAKSCLTISQIQAGSGEELFDENLDNEEGQEFDLATLLNDEYSGALTVSINGAIVSESTETVLIQPTDTINTINFTLKNFILGAGTEESMAIGNINIENIKLTTNGEQIEFEYADNILIAEGDDPNVEFWLGPALEEIPVSIKGVVTFESVMIGIDIEMVDLGQTIHVEFYTSYSFDDAINTISSAKKSNAAYSLSGNKIGGNLDSMPRGIYIVNGKKISK